MLQDFYYTLYNYFTIITPSSVLEYNFFIKDVEMTDVLVPSLQGNFFSFIDCNQLSLETLVQAWRLERDEEIEYWNTGISK